MLRTAHGRARELGAILIPEVSPPDELPPASPPIAVRSERSGDGRFTAGNTVARSKRIRPGKNGLAGAPSAEFLPFARWGSRYGAARRKELAQAHGGSISVGVGALVESAALALASSRFLDHRARQTGDADLFKQAAALAQTARQNELAAWELAAREAAIRPAPDAGDWWTKPP